MWHFLPPKNRYNQADGAFKVQKLHFIPKWFWMDTLLIVVHMKTRDLFHCWREWGACIDKETSVCTQKSDVAEAQMQHTVNCKTFGIWTLGTGTVLWARSSKKGAQCELWLQSPPIFYHIHKGAGDEQVQNPRKCSTWFLPERKLHSRPSDRKLHFWQNTLFMLVSFLQPNSNQKWQSHTSLRVQFTHQFSAFLLRGEV